MKQCRVPFQLTLMYVLVATACTSPRATNDPARPLAIEATLADVRSDDPEQRVAALEVLNALGPRASAAVPDLIPLLSDSREWCVTVVGTGNVPIYVPIRALVAETLGSIGPAAKPALASLRTIADEDPDQSMRKIAREAAAKIDAASD